MAYQALYRKYRPKTFSEVVGQEHVTETLKNELSEGKTVHAYLFTGTRGTGKTSCAKILAKAINCLSPENGDPCLKCESCLSVADDKNTDIIEIDAASNNSVDNIRELRDLINFSPSSSKYRVYIIDEVHMLTISAFNALLKTLEEPPAHVVFILATTEVHKLPATILSRCQRFDFRRIDSEKICERMHYIAKEEGLTLTDEAAMLIASAADGGMRDALSILDLCASNSSNIDEATVESVCAMAGNDYLIDLADSINNRDIEKALMLIDNLHNSSVDMLRLLSELTSHFRDLMIIKTVKSNEKPIVCSKRRMEALKNQAEKFSLKEIMFCLSTLQKSFSAMQTGNRRSEMELNIIKLCHPAISDDVDALAARVSRLEAQFKNINVSDIAKSDKPEENSPDTVETEITDNGFEEPTTETKDGIPQTDITDNKDTKVKEWDQIIEIISGECPLLVGVLNNSSAYIKGDYLLIDCKNDQLRSLLNSGNPIYKNCIRKAAKEILGVTYKLGPYTKETASTEIDPLLQFAENLKKFDI